MSFFANEMIDMDLKYIWHPCTQMKDHENIPLVAIKSAKGVYLNDYNDNSYIDGVSSWWVNLFGHCNDYIGSKIKQQLDTLEHVIFAGFTHEPIVTLSQRLCQLAPEGLCKCFYADNGSSGVEIALKMSFQYHKNSGKIRPFFLSLENSYHGETLGALSVGDVTLYKDVFNEIIIKTIQTSSPKNQTIDEAKRAACELEKLLKQRGDEISAFIIEPLVQCAGSMKMYHPLYVTLARELCTKYGVHLIADEVAVGFGRTGTMFACEQASVSPDFMVLSKGITGGYLPLCVVLTTQDVYDRFYCDYLEYKAFLHSHSYTGNPLACVAANAVLDIFENENVIQNNQKTIAYIAEKLKKFEGLSNVQEVRQTGMVSAIELCGYSPQERVGLKIFEYALARGVLLRPLGNVIYFMPPYIITCKEIDKVLDTAYDAISSLVLL
ncbi:MAG: adenosylmethionine--8-amino-7-oxononanoate transaminase [Sulfurospirillaceae bacterium]|nr:adenosylmethionine--8-amino-7-oxononanoate transaminase [Sulfurospirillaceae bacterium]